MPADAHLTAPPRRRVLRSAVIGTMAFLTVVDLFATQAILPSLTRHFGVSPAAMGLAVNASTIGMAIAGLGVGLLGQRSTAARHRREPHAARAADAAAVGRAKPHVFQPCASRRGSAWHRRSR